MAETTCPVFRPTPEEFADFRGYIEKIEKSLDEDINRHGIAKIIPPAGWPNKVYDLEKLNVTVDYPVQQVVSGRAGVFGVVLFELKAMAIKDFLAYDQRNSPRTSDPEQRVRKFWRSLGVPGEWETPIYGADQIGTLFEGDEGGSWNINKLDSIVSLLGRDVPGVSTAYLYVGTWRSLFAYHTEDLDLYSINFVHTGAQKSWYAVSPKDRKRFENVADSFFSGEKKKCSEYLRHKMTMFSPSKLKDFGIPFETAIQEPGEIIITFPGSYHAGFNHGFNVAESTNFATPRWFDIGRKAKRCLCRPHSVTIDVPVLQTLYLRRKLAEEKLLLDKKLAAEENLLLDKKLAEENLLLEKKLAAEENLLLDKKVPSTGDSSSDETTCYAFNAGAASSTTGSRMLKHVDTNVTTDDAAVTDIIMGIAGEAADVDGEEDEEVDEEEDDDDEVDTVRHIRCSCGVDKRVGLYDTELLDCTQCHGCGLWIHKNCFIDPGTIDAYEGGPKTVDADDDGPGTIVVSSGGDDNQSSSSSSSFSSFKKEEECFDGVDPDAADHHNHNHDVDVDDDDDAASVVDVTNEYIYWNGVKQIAVVTHRDDGKIAKSDGVSVRTTEAAGRAQQRLICHLCEKIEVSRLDEYGPVPAEESPSLQESIAEGSRQSSSVNKNTSSSSSSSSNDSTIKKKKKRSHHKTKQTAAAAVAAAAVVVVVPAPDGRSALSAIPIEIEDEDTIDACAANDSSSSSTAATGVTTKKKPSTNNKKNSIDTVRLVDDSSSSKKKNSKGNSKQKKQPKPLPPAFHVGDIVGWTRSGGASYYEALWLCEDDDCVSGTLVDIEEDLGRVHFKGKRRDKDEWVTLSNCIVIGSTKDGLFPVPPPPPPPPVPPAPSTSHARPAATPKNKTGGTTKKRSSKERDGNQYEKTYSTPARRRRLCDIEKHCQEPYSGSAVASSNSSAATPANAANSTDLAANAVVGGVPAPGFKRKLPINKVPPVNTLPPVNKVPPVATYRTIGVLPTTSGGGVAGDVLTPEVVEILNNDKGQKGHIHYHHHHHHHANLSNDMEVVAEASSSSSSSSSLCISPPSLPPHTVCTTTTPPAPPADSSPSQRRLVLLPSTDTSRDDDKPIQLHSASTQTATATTAYSHSLYRPSVRDKYDAWDAKFSRGVPADSTSTSTSTASSSISSAAAWRLAWPTNEMLVTVRTKPTEADKPSSSSSTQSSESTQSSLSSASPMLLADVDMPHLFNPYTAHYAPTSAMHSSSFYATCTLMPAATATSTITAPLPTLMKVATAHFATISNNLSS